MSRAVTVVAAASIVCLASIPAGSTQPGQPIGLFYAATIYEVSGEVAEIVDASPDGMTLAYSDSGAHEVGFVDISDPASPVEIDTVATTGDGEPTAVAYTPDGAWVLATVRDAAGGLHWLQVIHAATLTTLTALALPGQPDSIEVSRDGRYAAIAIENERADDGPMPDAPPGLLVIADLVGAPGAWTLRQVALTGLAGARFPDDPEPEFVTINVQNIVAVTLQENNCVALVDLVTGAVLTSWSAGTTTHAADLSDDGVVSFTETLVDARREPDAIVWTPGGDLVTANEGDYDLDAAFVGGRDFTIFATDGRVIYEPGASLEMAAASVGLYNDGRSDNKGCEIEGAAVGEYIDHTYLFVGAERCNFVAVYRLQGQTPKLVQVLPSGDRPEGLRAIAERGLLVAANEDDGTIWIYHGAPGASGAQR